MRLNIRRALAELMGKETLTDADIRSELDELKIDLRVEALTKDGHVPADAETQQLVRAAIAGSATSEQIETILRAAKPTPATKATLETPTGPNSNSDPTETAIQAEMARTNTPYHVAAAVISTGATLRGPD